MTEQLKAATIRSFYGAFWTAASVFFVTFQTFGGLRGERLEESAIASAAAFTAYMVSRGVVEGLIDSNRSLSAGGGGDEGKGGGDEGAAVIGHRGSS